MSRYIEESDFMRFMNKEELDLVWPLIDVANTGRLNRRALRAWVVRPSICFYSFQMTFILLSHSFLN